MRGLARRLPPFETLVPLLAAYLLLAALYAWQAWQRQTPTLFSDEIEFTQISRSIAETGDAALRGGEPAPGASLYAYLAAPAWWIDDVSDAYGLIKLLGVFLMTSAIFPAYALARTVVSRPYALFAAVGAAAAPALSYSPFLVEEPLAYPVSTLALFLIARAGAVPTRWSIGLAAGVSVVAVLVRSQLAVLLPILALVLLARAWRAERVRRWRETWTAGDWLGAAVLAVGVAVLLSAAIGRRSNTWYRSTGFFKDRMLEYGLWAVGALAIGIGVIPLIAGLVALVPERGVRDRGRSAFVSLSASALAVFGLYTAVKAAYLSTEFAIVIAERNLIYVVPLLFAGTALVLERRRPAVLATVAATAFAVYLVTSTPLSLDRYPNYEAHGLAIAAFANRIPKWPEETIETILVLVALGSGLAVLGLRFVRSAASGCRCCRRARRRGAHLEPDHRDLRGERRAPRVRPAVRRAAAASELGRQPDRRAAHRPRRAGDQRSEPDLAARVLEPFARVLHGAGRERAGTGTDRDPEPRRSGRDAGPVGAERRVRRRGRRSRDRSSEGGDRWRHGALPARWRAGAPARDENRRRGGRLDGRARDLHALRRRRARARLREGVPLPGGCLLPQPGSRRRHCRGRPRRDRPVGAADRSAR